MTTAVALDSSPVKILSSLRGTIIAARLAYPGVLHLDVRDADGCRLSLATQDANWRPEDPASLVGQTIEGATIDRETGTLCCDLSGGSPLLITPASQETEDDPPNWELITTEGLLLEFGPGLRWRVAGANDRVSLP